MTTTTTTTPPRPSCGMAARATAIAVLLAASLLPAGCDSGSFIPPPPPGPNEATSSGSLSAYDKVVKADPAPSSLAGKSAGKTSGGGVRIVELILARPVDADRAFLDQMLRRELAKAHIPLRLRQPESGRPSTPEGLADSIRAAIGRGASGLVVEGVDDPSVVDALHDVAGRGVAVLLLDRPVPARGGRTIPYIVYDGFTQIGRQLVDTALEADRSRGGGRARPGRIVLLHHRADDPYIDRSYASLLGPCKASGKPVETVEFDGDMEKGAAALGKAIDANSGIDIVLADDGTGMFAAFRAQVDRTQSGRHLFLLAGYTSYDYRMVTSLDFIDAMGDHSVEAYSSRAAQAMQSLLDGKPVGDVVKVPVRFHRSSTLDRPPAKEPPAPPSRRKP